MLIILGFKFLYYKLQICFICHVHYTPFTCDKIFLKIWNFQTYFEFLKFQNSTIFYNINAFWIWVIGYYFLKFLTIKFFILKESLT